MTPDILPMLGTIGIIPVVVIDDEAEAEPLARALIEGGLPTMEITFRTGAARRAIERVAKAVPEMLLGAGTVLSVEQVKTAVGSGARYIVSPGMNRAVVEYCLANNIPVTPGAVTPTEIGSALELGVGIVKFFPAEASGGVEYLKAVGAPFGGMRFIPTGGVNEANVSHYLRLPFVHACGGSWMVKRELITAGGFDEITRRTANAAALVAGSRTSSERTR
jgi:2-dehydro-3-deoxyphosphogluconate aldolase/(4S)-4-hydroxy-2-oxoglutarate aldolase